MKWSQVIEMWLSGYNLQYPHTVTKRFFYETCCCDALGSNDYVSKFIESDELEKIKTQDYSNFNEYIYKSPNPYVTSFLNKTKTSKLIIPMPMTGLNFATIKDFIDNASITQQKEFWKYTANEIKQHQKKYNKIYISTHGLGVNYFHLRIDLEPKYYQTLEFI